MAPFSHHGDPPKVKDANGINSNNSTSVSVDKAVAVVTEMPEMATAFTSCSCSHSRPGANTLGLSRDTGATSIPAAPAPARKNEYATALQPTIKAAQTAHARMEQCREWANVVAVAARDAEHADHGHGHAIGASNPFTTSPFASTKVKPGPAGHANGRTETGRKLAPFHLPGLPSNSNAHSNAKISPQTDGTSQAPTVPQAQSVIEEAYPPTAPAKWYDDPAADARSRSGSRAASRANTPTPGLSMTPSVSATGTGATAGTGTAGNSLTSLVATANGTTANGTGTTHRRPSTSALTALYAGDLKRAHAQANGHDGSGGDDDEPYPKRRSAPASPARPRSMLGISPSPRTTPAHSPGTSPDTRPRPLLSGTIASRTGPALAQVRAAFASVGVDSVSGSTTTTPSNGHRAHSAGTGGGTSSSSSPPAQIQVPTYATSAPDERSVR